jgi:hypothetical protein
MKKATLGIILNEKNQKLLLRIKKKGFGGKVNLNEKIKEGTIRTTFKDSNQNIIEIEATKF